MCVCVGGGWSFNGTEKTTRRKIPKKPKTRLISILRPRTSQGRDTTHATRSFRLTRNSKTRNWLGIISLSTQRPITLTHHLPGQAKKPRCRFYTGALGLVLFQITTIHFEACTCAYICASMLWGFETKALHPNFY